MIFRVVIQVFNLNTIGRGENELVDPTVVKDNIVPGENDIKQSKYHKHAIQILEGLGGQDNIVNLYCATRLRLELKDTSIIDQQKIKTPVQLVLLLMANIQLKLLSVHTYSRLLMKLKTFILNS